MQAIKVTLRQRELKSGKITLYLDFYPPVRNPRTNELSRRDYLGIYLTKNPKTPFEKQCNAEKLRMAEAIRDERALSVMREQFGFIDKAKQRMSFLNYFQEKCANHEKNWRTTLIHFKNFAKGECLFGEINPAFCNKFRDYLLDAKQLNSKTLKISKNTAANYWLIFRAVVSIAYKEKFLEEDVNKELEYIEMTETHRNFLTIDEVRKLCDTPCENDIVKRASIFSILTGLRMSDILALTWDKFETYPDGGHCIRLTTEKTDASAFNPISDEAYEICGEPSTGIVFNGLTSKGIYRVLPKWLTDAGITKHITFHCFRHTFATLLVSNGSDIYTVSKMLTHRSVLTTQIYADLIDEKKREAAELIKIKK